MRITHVEVSTVARSHLCGRDNYPPDGLSTAAKQAATADHFAHDCVLAASDSSAGKVATMVCKARQVSASSSVFFIYLNYYPSWLPHMAPLGELAIVSRSAYRSATPRLDV